MAGLLIERSVRNQRAKHSFSPMAAIIAQGAAGFKKQLCDLERRGQPDSLVVGMSTGGLYELSFGGSFLETPRAARSDKTRSTASVLSRKAACSWVRRGWTAFEPRRRDRSGLPQPARSRRWVQGGRMQVLLKPLLFSSVRY